MDIGEDGLVCVRRWILGVTEERIVESECVLHMLGQNGRGEEGTLLSGDSLWR